MKEPVDNRLKNTLLAGAVWDILGGIIFLVIHGILQKQLTPEIHPFYSIVLGLFLLTLAYIQLITSSDTKRYLTNIGVVSIFRIMYAITVIFYSVLNELLPAQFFMIAATDTLLTGLLLFFSSRPGQARFTELFIPSGH